MITSQEHNMCITRNIPFLANKSWTFIYCDNGSEITLDLTPYTAQLIARKDYNEEIFIDWNTTNGKLIISGNELLWNISSADTLALESGNYAYNLKFSSDSESDFEPVHGTITIFDNTIQE